MRRVSTEGNYSDSPSWSPRGDKIAYIDDNFNNALGDLIVIDTDVFGSQRSKPE